MIQIWIDAAESAKLAHFDNSGTCRFATIEGDYTADAARTALLASADVRTDIEPRQAASIVWHDDDKATIAAFYHAQIDTLQYKALNHVIGADIYRYIVYILKFLELMSAQLGLRSLTDSVILGHEAGDDPVEQQKLAATWSEKSGAWLEVVGKSEAAAKTTKELISAAADDTEMAQLVAAFPAFLSEALA